MLIREDSTERLGGDLIVARIIDILLVQIIRYWLENCKTDSVGWLMATAHTEIGKVLSSIHERPEEKWTIDSLAKEANISRTKLFITFTKEVGISPIQYLTNWRIDLSKQLLTTNDLSILEIANSVGYESEASFGRVFKKIEKIPPGKFRNNFNQR
ncbi:MAG: helix-turn-helix transcriptional regulator [Ectothiorhodospiraceae bacterium]|nr:helix-turn-helix transcriptional regulator [Ectothiorhodospiraceae bacterium]